MAAKECGLIVVLKFPYTRTGMQPTDLEALLGEKVVAGMQKEYFSVMPSVRPGTIIQVEEMLVKEGIPNRVCPMPVVTVREDGNAYTCCTPGGFVEALQLGNIREDRLEDINIRFRYGALQMLLTKEGPGYLANALAERGLSQNLRPGYIDVCDLCTHMMSNSVLVSACKEIAEEYQAARWAEAIEQIFELTV